MVEKTSSLSYFTGPNSKYTEKYSSLYKDINKNSRYNSHLYHSAEEEIKNNIQSIIDKIKNERKKNVLLKKQNQDLITEKMLLLNKSSQMIRGNSTSTDFPSENDIKLQLNRFINVELFMFFKYPLSSEFIVDGIVLFYKKLFVSSHNKIKTHFEKMNNLISFTLQSQKTIEPLDWILRKSSQANWKSILEAIENKESYFTTVQDIQNELSIETKNGDANLRIRNLCKKTLDILLKCYIMNPKIFYDVDSIGQRAFFDAKDHEAIEGTILSKTECFILTPRFYYFVDGKRVTIEKSKVISSSFSYID